MQDLNVWMNTEHGQMNFRLIQARSGHGCYKKYLLKMGNVGHRAIQTATKVSRMITNTLFLSVRHRSMNGAVMIQQNCIRQTHVNSSELHWITFKSHLPFPFTFPEVFPSLPAKTDSKAVEAPNLSSFLSLSPTRFCQIIPSPKEKVDSKIFREFAFLSSFPTCPNWCLQLLRS